MEQRVGPFICAVALVAALGALITPAALARPDGVAAEWVPPVAPGGPISLLDAIRATLENEPTIRIQSEQARYQKGFAQEAKGAFDTSILGELSYEYTQEELTNAQKEAERKRREDYQEQASDAGLAARDLEVLRDSIDARLTSDDACRQDGTCNACTAPPPGEVTDSELQAQLALLDGMIQDHCASGDLATAERLAASRDSWLYELKPLVTEGAEDSRDTEATAIQRLEQLGSIPEVTQDYIGSLDLKLRKPYRNGIVLTPYLQVTGEGTGYKGKPKDSELGGKGVQDLYKAVVGFTVDLPLGRGKGVESAGAAERAADIDYQASLEAVTHAAAASVYRTVLAYWNLVAAQKTLAAWEQSLELQGQLVDLTRALIDADELAAVELNQTLARQADVQGQVDNAHRQLHEARVTLARVIGFEVADEAQIPLAADDFPPLPTERDLELLAAADLAASAPGRRNDYRAAVQLQSSGKVLLRAAEVDLAPVTDLSLDLSFSGLDEDANMVTGLRGAFSGKWVGPSGKLGLTVDMPVANNVQRGRLAQQEALYRQQAISTADLERTIRANVILNEGQLREAVAEIEQTARAVELYRQSVANEIEKLRLGSSTMIDTILTEQRLTDSLLASFASAQRYARVLAALRFESGTLVTEQEGGRLVSAQDLVTVPAAPPGAGN